MATRKYKEKWTLRGLLRIYSMSIDGVVYRLKKPMVFKVVHQYQTEKDKTLTAGDRIRYDSWFAATRRWGVEGRDWDDLMEKIEKLIDRLASDGEIAVFVED